ncbi:hypothetical protein [Herbaspirillum huttiense]|uniref:Uncharacterized protein n=2 Tax=Herbaspirillum huttiense TaxID=863372 RepID=A0AAJ2LXQ5_9BURK|nr:hypothetical protein [Herbaspirillum huttiense]MDR9839416.1 hypothetical protein [Herbaspirillum huttiense]
MKAIFATALLGAFFLSMALPPREAKKEAEAQRARLAPFAVRIPTKFPDPAIAAMLPPAQNKD